MLALLPGLAAPDVSISRAGPVTVIALSTAGAVGVDVERADAAGFEGFAAVALHPSEDSASAQEQTVTWVRKESLLKATGKWPAARPGTGEGAAGRGPSGPARLAGGGARTERRACGCTTSRRRPAT